MTAANNDFGPSSPYRFEGPWGCSNASDTDCLLTRFLQDLDQPLDDRALACNRSLGCQQCGRSIADWESELADVGRLLRGASPRSVVAQEGDALRRIELQARQLRPLMAEAPDEPESFATLGAYQIHELLGQGGMGEVHRATHSRLKKVVAIKLLPPHTRRNPQAIARFQREIEAVGKLEHPNVVRASDAGEEHGRYFLVMEFVEGRDLGKIIANSQTIGIAETCEIGRQAAFGLQHAHERCLVHRDIKPSNLMLSLDANAQPNIKILDLGLAILSSDLQHLNEPLTGTGQLLGTLDFMSPEQTCDTRSVDHRSDIYSLGVTLYRMLTGGVPWAGDAEETPVKRLHCLTTQNAPPIETRRTDLPPALAKLINRMIRREPAERPQSMSEVASQLAPFAQPERVPDLLNFPSRTITRSTVNSGQRFPSSIETEKTIHTKRVTTAGGPVVEQVGRDATTWLQKSLPRYGTMLSRQLIRKLAKRGWTVISTIGFVVLAGTLWLRSNGKRSSVVPEPQRPLAVAAPALPLPVDDEVPADVRLRREIARWVCVRRGEVQTTVGLSIRNLNEIPGEPFGITGISLFDCGNEDVVQIVKWLPELPELYRLLVNGGLDHRLSNRGLVGIGDHLNLHRVAIGSRHMTAAAVEAWPSNPNLHELRLTDLQQLGDILDAVRTKAPNLNLLGVGTYTLKASELEAVSQMHSLRSLDLTLDKVSVNVLEPITRSPIEHLYLRGARDTEPAALTMLTGMPGLRSFMLQSVSFDDTMLEAIVVTDSLELLELGDTDATTPQLEVFSRRHPKLRILKFDRVLPTLQILNGHAALAP